MCSVLGRPADALPSTMPEIDRLLREVPDPARGRSKKTIANTRSRLKAALLHVADAPKLPPHGTPLRPEWAALYDALTDLRLRNGLSRLDPHRVVPRRRAEGRRRRLPAGRAGSDSPPSTGAATRCRSGARPWRCGTRPPTTVPGWPAHAADTTARIDAAAAPLARGPARHLHSRSRGLSRLGKRRRSARRRRPATPLKPSTLRQRREQLRLAASTLARVLGRSETRSIAWPTLVDPANMRRS